MSRSLRSRSRVLPVDNDMEASVLPKRVTGRAVGLRRQSAGVAKLPDTDKGLLQEDQMAQVDSDEEDFHQQDESAEEEESEEEFIEPGRERDDDSDGEDCRRANVPTDAANGGESVNGPKTRARKLKEPQYQHKSDRQRSKRRKTARSPSSYDAKWEIWFALLMEYKKEHGHTKVPHNYVDKSTGRKLGNWVNHQRAILKSRHQKGTCSEINKERRRRLMSIGFEWEIGRDRSNEVWESWFKLLAEYKMAHGHTRVPSDYLASSGLKLGTWVVNQRTRYARYQSGLHPSITEDRIRRLENIGFEWSTIPQGDSKMTGSRSPKAVQDVKRTRSSKDMTDPSDSCDDDYVWF